MIPISNHMRNQGPSFFVPPKVLISITSQLAKYAGWLNSKEDMQRGQSCMQMQISRTLGGDTSYAS